VTATNNCLEFAESLGLEPKTGGLFVGKLRGFPVGLKFIDPAGALLLLFEIRHWLKQDFPATKSITYEPEITQLLAEKKAEIEIEDQIAWLTIKEGSAAIQTGMVTRVLNSVLGTFLKAGFIGDSDLCHYCQKNKVESISVINGKVAQICPACLEEKEKGVQVAAGTAEAVPILLTAPFMAVVGALMWAFFWAAETLVFEKLNIDKVWIPGGIFIVLFVGIIVGGPIGWIIKLNRRRGHAVSVAAAILFGSLAVFVGEVFYLAWLIFHEFGVLSLSAAFRVMPAYYLHNDFMFIAFKLLTAFTAVAIAEYLARPKKAALKI